jgi:hypothetical protein
MREGQQQRAAAIKEWKTTRAAMTEQSMRAQEVERAKVMTQSLDTALNNLREEGSWLFAKSETDESWNQKVAERVDVVRGILQTGDATALAKYVADGVASLTYRKLYEDKASEVAKLRRELALSRGSQPGLGGDGAPPPVNPPLEKPMKPEEGIRALLSR